MSEPLYHCGKVIKALFRGNHVQWPDVPDLTEDGLFDFLDFHGLISVVNYLNFNTGCCRGWPEGLLKQIKGKAIQEALLENARLHDLQNVLSRMAQDNVRPLLIKGTALSCLLYPARGLRPRCDTDLLIHAADREKVMVMMKDMLYEHYFDVSEDDVMSQILYFRKGRINIWHTYDIHWKISNVTSPINDALCYARLNDTALPLHELGTNARTIGVMDSLLLACFHRAVSYSHAGERLIWLYDIHLLLEKIPEIELRAFIQNAKQLKIAAICSNALFTAHDWFNTSLPGWLNRNSIRPEAYEASVTYLQPGRLAGIKYHVLADLGEMQGWKQKMHYLDKKVFPPADYMIWRYAIKSRYLLPVFYLYRLIQGLYILARR